jgi:hypothetical protein
VTAPPSERIVEVIADLGEDAEPRYWFGSGCIVRGRTVLTTWCAVRVGASLPGVSV